MPQPPSRRNRGAENRAREVDARASMPRLQPVLASPRPFGYMSALRIARLGFESPGHAVAVLNAQSRAFDAGPLFGADRDVDPEGEQNAQAEDQVRRQEALQVHRQRSRQGRGSG